MRIVDADALVNVVETARKKAKTLTGMDFVMVTKSQPTIDAIPVEATAKRLQRAFLSDNWESWAEWLRGNYSDEDFVANVDGKKDAIPVEWLRQYAPEKWSIYMQAAVEIIIEAWQQEQEAR